MDLVNCLTWIVSLGLVKQARMVSTGVLPTSHQNLEPTGTIEAKVGGEDKTSYIKERHPWSGWKMIYMQAQVIAQSAKAKVEKGKSAGAPQATK